MGWLKDSTRREHWTPRGRRGSVRLATGAIVGGTLGLLVPDAGFAQEPSGFPDDCPPSNASYVTVSLTGVVADRKSDVALPGAQVLFEYEDRGSLPNGVQPRLETVTDEWGRYRFCSLVAFARVLTARR